MASHDRVPGFSQTLVVNSDQVSEKDTGDYLPWWLSDLAKAMIDPLPMLETLKQIGGQMPKPRGANSNTCADLRRIGGGVFCFERKSRPADLGLRKWI